jgi:predicted TIM-barrel fold metal-dependent hydrolase
MTTDLAHCVNDLRVIDTHEHMYTERQWLDEGPRDVLADLFFNYAQSDLVNAAASPHAVTQAIEGPPGDIESRWAGIADAWRAMRLTGYGEAIRIQAKLLYGIDELNLPSLAAAQPKYVALHQPGWRLRLLRDEAKLDHIQTDDKQWACDPDASGPDFFLYDLSWVNFCGRGLDFAALADATGITVGNLAQLRDAMARLFALHGPTAIAVKTQHAYNRTLRWQSRDDVDAERALQFILKHPDQWDSPEGLCLGDWGLARGAELAAEYNLPLKIHTGSFAGHNQLRTERIAAGHLCPLLIAFPQTKFVLMHIAYPYSDELIAIVKHFPNAVADLCWAWSINPRVSGEFVRRFIHAAPLNKLFAFGGDINTPTTALAYAAQMRVWLTKALQAEVDDGDLTESDAMDVARRILRTNQQAWFDIEPTRAAIHRAAGV